MHRPLTPSGFTLIELLSAMAVGMAVVATVMVTVRVAGQTTALANRLAVENGELAAGVLAALDDVDSWRSLDDPDSADPAATRLRGIDAARGLGLPFSPMAAAWPADAADAWDGDAARWSPHQPDGWWRGNIAEGAPTRGPGTDLRHGRYGIVGNVRAAPTIAGYGATAPHTWRDSQVRGLDRALGFCGLVDYLPPSATFEFNDAAPPPGALDAVGIGGLNWFWLTCDPWCDIAHFEPYSSRAIIALTPATSGWSVPQLVDQHRHAYETGWLGAFYPGDMTGFMAHAIGSTPLAPVRPATWPAVSVELCRAHRLFRFNTLCRVRWTSPITGQSSELSFSAFGTTLRGARRMRGLDGS